MVLSKSLLDRKMDEWTSRIYAKSGKKSWGLNTAVVRGGAWEVGSSWIHILWEQRLLQPLGVCVREGTTQSSPHFSTKNVNENAFILLHGQVPFYFFCPEKTGLWMSWRINLGKFADNHLNVEKCVYTKSLDIWKLEKPWQTCLLPREVWKAFCLFLHFECVF